jgi:hypothetical protein
MLFNRHTRKNNVYLAYQSHTDIKIDTLRKGRDRERWKELGEAYTQLGIYINGCYLNLVKSTYVPNMEKIKAC